MQNKMAPSRLVAVSRRRQDVALYFEIFLTRLRLMTDCCGGVVPAKTGPLGRGKGDALEIHWSFTVNNCRKISLRAHSQKPPCCEMYATSDQMLMVWEKTVATLRPLITRRNLAERMNE